MLLVGQAPSRDSDPARAFSGRSGERLCQLSGLTHREFWDRVDAINLIDAWPGKRGPKGDRFNLVEARKAAVVYMNTFADRGPSYRSFVLVGRMVATAFGLGHLDWFACYGIPCYAVIPHPSGANYLWNQPAIVERARAFFRERLPR